MHSLLLYAIAIIVKSQAMFVKKCKTKEDRKISKYYIFFTKTLLIKILFTLDRSKTFHHQTVWFGWIKIYLESKNT